MAERCLADIVDVSVDDIVLPMVTPCAYKFGDRNTVSAEFNRAGLAFRLCLDPVPTTIATDLDLSGLSASPLTTNQR